MALFPMFIDLQGQKVIVVGGGHVALRKIRQLLSFGADICVISGQIDSELFDLVQKKAIRHMEADIGDNTEICHDTEVLTVLLADAAMVICATNDKRVNAAVASYCRQQRIPVNCADSAAESSFVFPSVVRRGDVVVGITTSGNAPALTRHLRGKIEDAVPAYYGELADKIGAERRQIIASDASEEEKKSAMQAVIKEWERRYQS